MMGAGVLPANGVTVQQNLSLGTLEPCSGEAMFRFDQLIRLHMIVRDVKQLHPETIPVFEAFGFRASCDDCDIVTVARKNGISTADVLDALNRAVFGPKAAP